MDVPDAAVLVDPNGVVWLTLVKVSTPTTILTPDQVTETEAGPLAGLVRA